MHLPKFHSLLNRGWKPELQSFEISTSLQIPSFHIVGLPGPEVAEARERVRAAIESSALEVPRRRIVVNLSPASVRKQGTGLDLALALTILWEDSGLQAAATEPRRWVAWGELGLDGTLKPAGQATRLARAAWDAAADFLLVATEEEAQVRDALSRIAEADSRREPAPRLLSARTLAEAWTLLKKIRKGVAADAPTPLPPRPRPTEPAPELLPLGAALERVLGACASGRHHLMLLGPRGTGKSQALEWIARLLPEPGARILSEQALLSELADPFAPASHRLPVRRIGLNARPAALLGQLSGSAGRTALRPGEFSRAHGGLLLADEFPEWQRDSRECLREPLERGRVTLSRVAGTVELPAEFQLAATGNLCPCGGWPPELPLPDSQTGYKKCRCSPDRREGYLARLSGPVMDRVDCVVRLGRLPSPERRTRPGTLEALASRVARARVDAESRWGGAPGLLDGAALEDLLEAHPRWRPWLEAQASASLRSRHKTLRLALSLAVWDGLTEPGEGHFAEAATYRPERFGIGI